MDVFSFNLFHLFSSGRFSWFHDSPWSHPGGQLDVLRAWHGRCCGRFRRSHQGIYSGGDLAKYQPGNHDEIWPANHDPSLIWGFKEGHCMGYGGLNGKWLPMIENWLGWLIIGFTGLPHNNEFLYEAWHCDGYESSIEGQMSNLYIYIYYICISHPHLFGPQLLKVLRHHMFGDLCGMWWFRSLSPIRVVTNLGSNSGHSQQDLHGF